MVKEEIGKVRKIGTNQIGVNIPISSGYEIGDNVLIMPVKFSDNIEKLKKYINELNLNEEK